MSTFKNLKKVNKIYKQHCFNIRKKMKKISIRDYLRSELENSTTHGLRYIVNKRLHYLEKSFWVINVLACIILVVILLNIQYSRFVAAPTVMSVEMNYFDWNISYPAITLCPLYKPDAVRFATFLNETNKKTGLKTNGYFWAISQAALDTLEYMDLTATEDVKKVLIKLKLAQPKDYATVAASLFRKFENGWLTTNTNWSVSVEAAMTEMGMCHVINSNVAIYDKPYDWSAPVPAYRKKNIELSVFEADYFTEITNYANIYKVFIHSPDEVTMRTTSSFGFDVEGSISFGLSVWSTRISDELRHTSLRMRKCRFTNEPIGERYPIYSHNHCILECRIKMIQRLCGCVPHFYRTLGHERICYIEELQCVLKYRREIVTLAASNETLKNFNYHKDLPTVSRDCGCLSTCELDLYYKDREDFTPESGMNKLKIKITSFPKVRVVRDIIFNFNDVILRSGGVVNLCIGSSIISMMEYILVTAKIIIYMLLQILQLFLI